MAAEQNSRFIAGHYVGTVTYGTNTADIGTTETGFTITRDNHVDPIKIDELGDTTMDGIYRGGNMRIRMQSVTANVAGVLALQNFYDSPTGTIGPVGLTIGGGGGTNMLGYSLHLQPLPGFMNGLLPFFFPVIAPDGQSGGFNANTKNRRVDLDFLVFPLVTTTGSGTNQVTTAVLFNNT